MAIFNIMSGQVLRMDRLFVGASSSNLIASFDSDTAVYTATRYDASGNPMFRVETTAGIVTLPHGAAMYPVHSSGVGWGVGDLTFTMNFYDYASGSPVLVGTLQDQTWHDVALLETPVYQSGTTTIIDYTYEVRTSDPMLFGNADSLSLGATGDDFFIDAGGALQASLGAGNDICYLNEPGSGVTDIKFVDAGDGNDQIYYQSGNGTILGGAGNDAIGDNGGADGTWLFNGGSGLDTIYAYMNSTILDQNGSGNDLYFGTSQVTLSYADATAAVTIDVAAGHATGVRTGTDSFTGIVNFVGSRVGDTMFQVTNGAVKFDGSRGDDTLNGGGGNDTLLGGTENDSLGGGGGNDSLRGGTGNDVLTGNAGNDTLSGDDGDDRLNGGTGADLLTGGRGIDTFVFSAAADSSVAIAGRDRITGFVVADDHIDLSAIDALPLTPGDDAFTFIGSAAFTAVGQVRYEQIGSLTVVTVNLSGSIAPEMRIDISGLHTLTAANFDL